MDSVFSALWLATQTRDSICYLPPNIILHFAEEFYLISQKNKKELMLCWVCYPLVWYSPQCRWRVIDIYLHFGEYYSTIELLNIPTLKRVIHLKCVIQFTRYSFITSTVNFRIDAFGFFPRAIFCTMFFPHHFATPFYWPSFIYVATTQWLIAVCTHFIFV